MLIQKPQQLHDLCDELRAARAPIAIDTEFLSEKRYFAKLCLVQVFCEYSREGKSRQVEAIVDPLAVDIAPLLEIVADDSFTKIVHAGGQDLQIFFQSFGCAARHVFDTQIAGAFLGYGHQAGYADLVRRVAGGPQLSKKHQFTDWSARPLSSEQMDYALDDVRYLPKMYARLRAELEKRGRLEWARTEFRRAEAKASTRVEADELYRRFNLSGLSRRQLGTLRELASARDALARAVDRPPSFIVPDLSLLQIAKYPPKNAAELRATRGLPGLSEKQSAALLEAAARAAQLSDAQLPQRDNGEKPDPQLEAVAALLGVVVNARAGDNDISRTYLAPREQINALAAWWLRRDNSAPPELQLLADWRREIVGEELLQLLTGKRVLALDATPGKPAVRVVETP